MYVLKIDGKFISFNDYVKAQREGAHAGNAAKQNEQRKASKAIEHGEIQRFSGAVDVCICWIEDSRRRDWDNVTYAAKFILDALTDAGIIVADNQRYIPKPIINVGAHDPEAPRVVVLVESHDKRSGNRAAFGEALKSELGFNPFNDSGAM